MTPRGQRPGARIDRRAVIDRGPRPLREALDDVVAGLGPRGASSAARAPASAEALGTIFSGWSRLVGPAVARHTRPLRLEGGALVVAVDEAPWATQVRVLAPGILARLAEETGERLDRLDVVVHGGA